MKRRQPSNTTKAAVQAANTKLPPPPEGFDFDEAQMETWWELVRSRREWRKVDLRIAGEIIELLADQRELREVVRREGRFVKVGGEKKQHHAQKELLAIGKQILSYYRTMGLKPQVERATLNREASELTKRPDEDDGKKGLTLLATG